MDTFVNYLSLFFSRAILIYALFIMISYIILAYISIRTSKKYIKNNQRVDYSKLLTSNISPSISILAPAYNEAPTINDNIKSLLSIEYKNFEVVIINDGSKDETLQNAIDEFQLEPVKFSFHSAIPTQLVKQIYKSKLKEYHNLIVIDKENGGKADALNAGVNVSVNRYITSIDVDCILEKDSLVKMIKPFLQEKTRVIATGGVIRIANSCKVVDGKIKKVKAPNSFLARVQTIEYLRAFLLGRMAWSRMDGLLLISGAFGMFDKEIVIKSGGYSTKTVGEDMELLVRMRRYMIDNKHEYTVKFIPDPLCWTEVPEDIKTLTRQRNRWTRGTIETLLTHKKMCFNPKYKILGLLSYPYWLVFEFLAPIIEIIGLCILLFLAIFGSVNWMYFLFLFGMIYSFSVMFSFLSLLAEEKTYAQYKKFSDIFKLMGAALVEPFIFHPLIIRAAMIGNAHYIDGKTSWGEMKRKGFQTKD